jgi:pantoate--beta-alanine ligase
VPDVPLVVGGERNGDVLRESARNILQAELAVDEIDYVSVASMLTLDEQAIIEGRAMVSAAIRMGSVRLIDNIILE